METATQQFTGESPERLDTTVQHFSISGEETVRSVARKPAACAWGLAIAFGVLTAPIQYVDPRTINVLSGATSIEWEIKRRRGRAISLREARAIALQILADAEQEIRRDWSREAQYFSALWDNDEVVL